jgi:hypothetical protein
VGFDRLDRTFSETAAPRARCRSHDATEGVAEGSKEVTSADLDQDRQVRCADSRGQIGFDVGSNQRCLPGREASAPHR